MSPFDAARVEREEMLCQRYEGNLTDDVKRLCWSGGRAAEASVFVCTWKGALSRHFLAGSDQAGCICPRLLQGLQ